VRGHALDEHGGGGFRVDPGRKWQDPLGGYGDALGIAGWHTGPGPRDEVTGRDPAHAGADLGHGAGALVAGDERERARPPPGPRDDIQEVDADRGGLDDHFAAAGLWVRPLRNGQYLGAAVL
jgi:hypothetical protein